MTDSDKLKAYKQLVEDLCDCLDEVCYEKDWCRDPTPENMVASAVRLLQDFFDATRRAAPPAADRGAPREPLYLGGKFDPTPRAPTEPAPPRCTCGLDDVQEWESRKPFGHHYARPARTGRRGEGET